MTSDTENTPIGENEDQFTEGSYQAIKKADEASSEQSESSEQPTKSDKTITDIQNDTDPGSAEDIAREQGPYGVQE